MILLIFKNLDLIIVLDFLIEILFEMAEDFFDDFFLLLAAPKSLVFLILKALLVF